MLVGPIQTVKGILPPDCNIAILPEFPACWSGANFRWASVHNHVSQSLKINQSPRRPPPQTFYWLCPSAEPWMIKHCSRGKHCHTTVYDNQQKQNAAVKRHTLQYRHTHGAEYGRRVRTSWPHFRDNNQHLPESASKFPGYYFLKAKCFCQAKCLIKIPAYSALFQTIFQFLPNDSEHSRRF